MKRFHATPNALVLVAVAALAVAPSLRAATNAADVSSNYTTATWVTGSNQGTGFGAWNLFGNSGNNGGYGNYVGGTGLSSSSFGIYSYNANSGASFDAQRPLSGALAAGQTFSVDLGHTTIQSGGSVGINFQSGTGASATTVFSVIANGSSWSLNDGGSSNFGVAADATNTDFKFTFTYNGGKNYSFTLTNSSGGSNYTATNDLSNITQIQFFDYQQGGGENFGFDNLSVVPEPSTVFGGLAVVISGAVAFCRSRRATTAGKPA